jgi:hypothetical protein
MYWPRTVPSLTVGLGARLHAANFRHPIYVRSQEKSSRAILLESLFLMYGKLQFALSFRSDKLKLVVPITASELATVAAPVLASKSAAPAWCYQASSSNRRASVAFASRSADRVCHRRILQLLHSTKPAHSIT